MNTEALMTVFSWVGILTVAGFVIMVSSCAFDALRNVVRDWRWTYKYKHRFDKPPTAACYCKDCKWHSVKDNKCSNATWADIYTPDNAFCYDAEPMTLKEDARRGKAD